MHRLLPDPEGVKHPIEITAGTLFEAAVVGMNALQVPGWLGRSTLTIEIRVKQPETVHTVSNAVLTAWGCRCRRMPDRNTERIIGQLVGIIEHPAHGSLLFAVCHNRMGWPLLSSVRREDLARIIDSSHQDPVRGAKVVRVSCCNQVMSVFVRVLMVLIGPLFIFAACKKDARMYRLFSRGRGPGAELTVVGRICVFLIGALSIFVGLTGITEFWRF